MSFSPKSKIQRQFMLTSALAVPCVFGYAGRQAYAACSPLGGGTYLCSGATTTTQTVNADNATVSMASGATIDTTGGTGNAITVTGNGALGFTNTAGGAIRGQDNAISVTSTGDDGATEGAVTVNVKKGVSAVDGHGIFATTSGTATGSITVSSAAVTSSAKDGIYAYNVSSGANITITSTGTVTGANHGFFSRNLGTGSMSITARGASGSTRNGIYAFNGNSTTDLSVTATGTTSGATEGILANNLGTGSLTITAKSVTGAQDSALYARNLGTDLSIRASGTVTLTGATPSSDTAVDARNFGSGTLTVDTVDVSSSGLGISAENFGTDLRITSTGSVTGAWVGIYGKNSGSGSLTIDAVNATGGARQGIEGRVESTGTDLAITAKGTVTGETYGIFAKNEGSGVLTVTAAVVTGKTKDGIYARNASTGTDISVTATGTVSGGERGIYARNDGNGNMTITTVEASGTNNSGIMARNFNSAGNLDITATGTVSGASSGLYARNFGTGTLTITATDVEGFDVYPAHNTANGINAENYGTHLSITSSGTVTGTNDGIGATNMGTGSLTISAMNVTGTAGDGISALNSYSGTDLTVTAAGTVSGATHGITLRNNGTGAITVNAHNAIGTSEDGIYARTASAGADITVTGAVYGGRQGIGLSAAGPNTIAITGTGFVSGRTAAIDTTGGTPASDDTVLNHGIVTGDVDLGGGTNAFDNRSSGYFNSGATVNLGAGNTLTNQGDLAPGGSGTIQTTALTGNLVQGSGATFSVDMNADSSTADLLNITGTAVLAGNVRVNPLNLIDPSTPLTILSAAGGVTDNGLTARDTAVVDYTLIFPNATDVAIGDRYIDFTPVTAGGASVLGTQNERNVGANMNAIYATGGGELHDLQLELMKIESIETYEEALDRLHGEHYLVQAGAAVGSLHGFRETLLSCPSRLDRKSVV